MDNESNLDDDSLIVNETNLTLSTEVLAKLRRLKIQESLLTAALNKSNFEQIYHNSELGQYPNWKVYSSKLKRSIGEIKAMLEDVKNATSENNDNLNNIDIDEVKKDILTLDGKIKELENYIRSELALLKKNEEEIMTQLNEDTKLEQKVKIKLKVQPKQCNAVVPSPIRVLINSPLKCPEVQKFQEFMSKSKNRYGGWNEYNHNIFTQTWNKFYAADDIEVLEKNMQEINNKNLLQQFMGEIFEKIPDTNSSEILLHSKWYSEYCYLKMCQKTALDKWRDNKRKIKKRQNVKRNVPSESSNNEKLRRKQNENNKYKNRSAEGHLEGHDGYTSSQILSDPCNSSTKDSKQLFEDELFNIQQGLYGKNYTRSIQSVKPENKTRTGFAKPTEQWTNRCQVTQETPQYHYSNIERVDKLCVPNWRLGLK